MRNKIVLWGSNPQEEKVLVALELQPDRNKVLVHTFPESVATEEFYQLMMDQWRNDQEVAFPEEHTTLERELTMTEELLPEDIKVERGDLIQRAQTEWHFIVLSSKLNETYKSELEELEEGIARLDKFEEDVWESLKNFWDKVQTQVRERTLLRDHADELRNRTNAAFEQMKRLRSRLDEEYRQSSRENVDKFIAKIDEIEAKIAEGLQLNRIFDELKDLQKRFRDTDFTRDHRGKVWQRIDAAFKAVKEKRFGGSSSEDDRSPNDRTQRRYNGLLAAIDKMEKSIQRDESDLAFQQRKVAQTDGQLEAQIRQAKIQMIEQRIVSKREKLTEMLQTKTALEDRLEKIREREAKRQERELHQQARDAAKEKIAEEIRSQQAVLADDQERLEKAAQAITKTNPDQAETAEEDVDTTAEAHAGTETATTAPAAEEPEAAPIVTETEAPTSDEPTTPTAAEEPEAAPIATETEAPAEDEPTMPTDEEPEATPVAAETEAPADEATDRNEEEKKSESRQDSFLAAAATTLGESLEDVVDTVRAVANVAGDRIEHAVDDLRHRLQGEEEPAKKPAADVDTVADEEE